MRLTRIAGVLALIAIFSFGLSSCGYSEKAAEKMVEKYDDGDMTKDDFSKCIDWMEEAYGNQEDILDELISDSKNLKRFEKNIEDAEEEYEKKWADIDDIENLLDEASYGEDKDMGSSNIKRWEKLKEKHGEKMDKLFEKARKKFDE